ncbi:hypothetical protein L6R46_09620 [Myxococcota bacterium]|nr:hypothetical protein [Myxococcota bacterium]
MHRVAFALAALVSSGCGSGGGGLSDAERLSRALALPPDAVEEAITLCEGIRDAGSAGACVERVVIALDGAEKTPGARCDRVPKGVWREECYFQAAEIARRRGDTDLAGSLCARSGPFLNDCGQHLWQSALKALVEGNDDPAERRERAERLYHVWEPVLGEGSDLSSRFWQRYYQHQLERDPVLSFDLCEAETGDDQVTCRKSVGQLYLGRIRAMVGSPRGPETLCALGPQGVVALSAAPGLNVKPDPAFDRVLAGQVDWVCTQGHMGPPPPELMESAGL